MRVHVGVGGGVWGTQLSLTPLTPLKSVGDEYKPLLWGGKAV